MVRIIIIIILFLFCQRTIAQNNNGGEAYRPLIHFTPAKGWMNDPNGMVYYKGVYHLFYQYHPNSSVWGPMHWGHATSTDLVHWKHEPIALYPDSIGTIFSGSAVLDVNNTSGFGKKGVSPLVAIFTQHSHKGEDAGRNDFQNQSIAYSLDNGKSWTKYTGNPVIRNPGIKDFRDPKVIWHTSSKRWIMTLAVANKVQWYTSPDLKNWTYASEFGSTVGAHGGVWECPDLFSMQYNGKTIWVLLVNMNPGGPNGGSVTQYFLGDFDGKKFTASDTMTRWLDYGPDEYAGITWSNTGNRKIFLGWMSNWSYATVVPTENWRSAMTIARELKLMNSSDGLRLVSYPVAEMDQSVKKITHTNIPVHTTTHLDTLLRSPAGSMELEFTAAKDFGLRFSNTVGDELLLGFDAAKQEYYADRTRSGLTAFSKEFASKAVMPRFSKAAAIRYRVIWDKSSVEVFADDGLSVQTVLVFPRSAYTGLTLTTAPDMQLRQLSHSAYR
jgi:fructan beta-fructosidase